MQSKRSVCLCISHEALQPRESCCDVSMHCQASSHHGCLQPLCGLFRQWQLLRRQDRFGRGSNRLASVSCTAGLHVRCPTDGMPGLINHPTRPYPIMQLCRNTCPAAINCTAKNHHQCCLLRMSLWHMQSGVLRAMSCTRGVSCPHYRWTATAFGTHGAADR